jgi:3-keto-5-aminohexanoate cleavage enzyme
MEKLMIEVALNESSTKEANPNVPYTPEEIARDAIACANAGAVIVHYHPRDLKTGQTLFAATDLYAEVNRLVRKESDVILYPTYHSGGPPEQRVEHIAALATDPVARFEMATLDLGATGFATNDPKTGKFLGGAQTYINTHDDTIYLLKRMKALDVWCNFGLREIGHMRHISAYRQLGLVPSPVVVKIFMWDDCYTGPMPDARGILAYLDAAPKDVPLHWFMTSKKQAIRPLSMLAAAMGGHIRTGLGDAPRLDGKTPTNTELVQLAVDMAHMAGREVATIAEARQMMNVPAFNK